MNSSDIAPFIPPPKGSGLSGALFGKEIRDQCILFSKLLRIKSGGASCNFCRYAVFDDCWHGFEEKNILSSIYNNIGKKQFFWCRKLEICELLGGFAEAV